MARIANLFIAAVATLVLLRPRRGSSFPSYQDPFVAGPPIISEGWEVTPCSSVLFQNASFPKKTTTDDADADDGPGYVLDYHAPGGGCGGPWNRVVLRVTGSVGGVQYDRWGHVSLNGVELVRLTTPEPAGGGVTTWRVERDVTSYSPIFVKSRRGGVRVLVGNMVDRTYTGVIHLTAELLFYPSKSARAVPLVQAASYVRGLLSNAPLGGDGGMDDGGWTLKGIKGNETLNATVTLPFRNAVRAHVDLYASAHGCEEFWYTNPPTSYSRLHPPSYCGGGAARELVLYVDGMMAGVVPPFPVMYSGGINPLLWRPQGGMRSFSVSPYFFDVTPFLALLNDGGEHSVSVGVTSNSEGGSWYPNPILVVYRDAGGGEEDGVVDGTITLHESSAVAPEPTVVNDTSVPHTNIAFVTTRSTTLRVWATFRGGGGTTAGSNSSSSRPPRYEETYFSVSSINTNSIGKVVGDTRGVMNATVNSTAYGRNETLRFPYEVWSSFRQGSDCTFEIVANVSQGQHRTVHYSSSPSSEQGRDEGLPPSLVGAKVAGTVVFVHELRGNATYNRSTTEDRTPHVEEASSAQRFSIIALALGGTTDGDGYAPHCFEQEITAHCGYVDRASVRGGGCNTPDWFCSVFDACSAAAAASPPPVHDASHAPLSRFDRAAASPNRFSAVRHPRQVWNATNVVDE